MARKECARSAEMRILAKGSGPSASQFSVQPAAAASNRKRGAIRFRFGFFFSQTDRQTDRQTEAMILLRYFPISFISLI